MKFTLLLSTLVLGFCSTPSQTKVQRASAGEQAIVVQDTITPGVYDAQDKIILVKLSDEVWKEKLSEQAFHVLREEGTERAFSGKYWDNHNVGVYTCGGCALPLFSSETKFESGTGWPSFTQPLDQRNVKNNVDMNYGMVRTEVECSRCGGHLGHVFPDGPKPTGLRYCINSVSLGFVPGQK